MCGFGLLGPRPAWSTRHQTLCHCLPKSLRTRCPAAAVLCQRLASRHTPFRGFHNLREGRPITTQNPVWAFTALPLPSQVTGHVAIIHLEGFKTCAKHCPSGHKTPLWAFSALPLPSQVTANTLPYSSSPLPAPGQLPYSI